MLEKMKLRTKLSCLFFTAVVAVGLVSFAGIDGLGDTTQSIEEIGDVRLPSVTGLELMTEGLTALKLTNMTASLSENDYHAQAKFAAVLAQRKNVFARIEKGWQLYEPLPQTPDEAVLWKRFLDEWKQWKAVDAEMENVISSLSRNQSEQEQKMLFADYFRRLDTDLSTLVAAESTLAKITELNIAVARQAGDLGKAQARSARFEMFTVIGVAFAALAGLVFVVSRSILAQLGGEPALAVSIAKRIASGDLSQPIHTGRDDTTSLMHSIKTMQESLIHIVGRVRSSTDTIATASSQVAAGSQDLSSRTEQQAGSLEETASSMEELTSTVKQNAENAHEANQLAVRTTENAVAGATVVSQVVETMSEINNSATKIVDIISVIDGIAFQTNILALNAAVEAARAGEQGRGFAVVAAEVRGLAQRSASAAKEIKLLITDSVDKVSSGNKLADQAGMTMHEIVNGIQRVTGIMTEIAAASNEQSSGLNQINMAVVQMDNVTQQNAALVEEAAAAAQSLQDQAAYLSQLVSVFKLDAAEAGAFAQSAATAHRALLPV